MPSASFGIYEANAQRVDDILSFHDKELNAAAGPPPGPDRSLVLGAIALTYASWEAYIEQVAVEVVTFLAGALTPQTVPTSVQQELMARYGGWDLAGDGWRTKWTELVSERFLGTGTNGFGLNTASPGTLLQIFSCVGLNPFANVSWQNMGGQAVKDRLSDLVVTRGTIVHSAQAPQGVGLNAARDFRNFSRRLVQAVDSSLSTQALGLAQHAPWQ